MFRKVFAIVLTLFLISNIYALTEDQVSLKTSELFLISPLDNSEKIIQINPTIYENKDYWVIETNNDFFIISDKNAEIPIKKELIKPIIQTHLFYENIKQTNNNKKIAYFFNSIPNTITNFNFQLELMKAEVQKESQDNNVIIAINNVETRAKNIGLETIDLTKNIQNIDNNLQVKSYNSFNNIIELKNSTFKNITNLNEKLSLLQQSILELKIILVDANISTELKSVIGNQALILPQDIGNIPQYLNLISENLEQINNTISSTEDYKIYESLESNWETRLKRQSFLEKYLSKDKTLESLKIENPKELFDNIISQKDFWEDVDKTTAFIKAYNNFYKDIENNEYQSAERQINPLKDSAIKIIKAGKKESAPSNTNDNTTIEEESTNPFIKIAIIVIVGIILVLVIINIIKKIKEKKKTEEPQELNFEFK